MGNTSVLSRFSPGCLFLQIGVGEPAGTSTCWTCVIMQLILAVPAQLVGGSPAAAD